MSSSTSSAEWPKLFRYSDRGLQIDRELVAEANRLSGTLRHFEATCTEYRVSVSHLAGDIQGYAHRAEETDAWVRTVGVEFQRADQIGSVVFGGDTTREFLQDIIIAERIARIGFAKGLRFRPYAGWGVFFRDSILKLGYKGKWTILGPRSALRAAGITKNVRLFGYKYFSKVLTIKSGSWTGAAKAVWNRLLREPGSIFRKLPRAANAFVRKLPRSSPYLPAATFKQRIAEAFGKGASIGGKLKSAAGIGILITIATNIYEFHWGTNRHLGLRSRQFVTSTGADVSATLGIIAVSTAVGSLIPIPVVGTVAGFLVGVGLAFAYDKWGKDAWRNAVDGAGKRLQDALTPAQRTEQIKSYKEQRDIARGAADVSQQGNKGIPLVIPSLTPQPSNQSTFASPTGRKLADSPYYKYGTPYASGTYAGSPHPGIDLPGFEGEPLRPIGAGTVVKIGNDEKGYGNYVVIEHVQGDGSKLYSVYAHLQNKSPLTTGEPVTRNTVIGSLGMSGAGSGGIPHLHLEIRTQEGFEGEVLRSYQDLKQDDWEKYWLNPEKLIGNRI